MINEMSKSIHVNFGQCILKSIVICPSDFRKQNCLFFYCEYIVSVSRIDVT